ncbi:NfrA family protein [Microbulbifer guangxiensis]|uniref:NfrA family protein n=1 Tax=Microbulbifer guangxiensis TaxID=2904249 RepID=UPI001F398AC1|nr:hypothetical protein [Microbulbifer guangxiensis]
MKKRILPSVLLLAIAFSSSAEEAAVFDFAKGLDEAQQYKIFPFVERGIRSEKRGDLAGAEEQFRKVKEIVGLHFPTLRLLIDVLVRQGHYQEAADLLKPFASTSSAARKQLLVLYEKLLDPHDIESIRTALRLCIPEGCKPLIESMAYRSFMESGADSASLVLSQVLEVVGEQDLVEVHSLKSSYDEMRKDWLSVRTSLELVSRARPLLSDEFLRLGFSYVNLDELTAVESLISTRGESFPEESQQLHLAVIQRAMAAGEHTVGLKHYDAIAETTSSLLSQDRKQLAYFLIKAGRVEEAESFVTALDEEKCETLVDFHIATGKPNKARAGLLECPYTDNAAHWLELAINLGAEDALKSRTFSGELERRRLTTLADLLMVAHRFDEVVDLLSSIDRPLDPGLGEKLAFALEHTGKHSLAADIYAELAQHQARPTESRAADYVDKASYLYMRASQPNLARVTLLSHFPFARFANAQLLNQRLMGLLHLVPANTRTSTLLALRAQTFDEAYAFRFAELWKTGASCRALAEKLAGDSLRLDSVILGHCYADTAPGLAAHYFGQAENYGGESLAVPLAFAYFKAGEYGRSLESWHRVPEEAMAPELKKAAARVALAGGEYQQAAVWWQGAALEDDQDWWLLGAKLAEAVGKLEPAVSRLSKAMTLASSKDPEHYYLRALLLRQLGRDEEAWRDERELAGMDRLAPHHKAHLAYAGIKMGDRHSSEQLEQALKQAPVSAQWREQLVYLHEAEGQNAEAVQHIRALSESVDAELPPLAVSAESMQEKEGALRQLHENLSRRYQLSVGAWHGFDAGRSIGAGMDFDPFNTQGGYLSYEYRLGESPVVHGRQLAVYGRGLMANSDDAVDFVGLHSRSRSLGIGLRWKPVASHDVNLFLELNRRSFEQKVNYDPAGINQGVPAGSSRRDTRSETDALVRVSASLLNGASPLPLLPAGVGDWLHQDLYVDMGHWVQSHDYQFTARYTAGPQFGTPWPAVPSVQPYGFLQYDRNSDHLTAPDGAETFASSRAGLGVAVHLLNTGRGFDSFSRRLSLKLEFQQFLQQKNFPEDFAEEGFFFKLEGTL